MSAYETVSAFWLAMIVSAAVIAPYILLRRSAKSENWRTALMNGYLPWLAAALVLLGTFGVG